MTVHFYTGKMILCKESADILLELINALRNIKVTHMSTCLLRFNITFGL